MPILSNLHPARLHYRNYVGGAQSMDAFIAGLRKLPYNDIDPDYDNKLRRQFQSILKWKGICQIK